MDARHGACEAMGDKKKVREVFAKSYAAFHEEELDEGPVH